MQREAMNEDQNRTPLVRSGLLTEQEQEISWAKKFSLIREELEKDPARSDGLISKTLGVVSKASVYRVRETLLAEGKIKDVPITQRVTVGGWLAKGNGADNFRNKNGNRILVPPGKVVADLIKEGLAAEEAGMLAPDVSRLLGVGERSYREGRAIVLLSERKDLDEAESFMVKKSVEEMNATLRTHDPYLRLRSLVDRVWGKRNPKSKKGAKKQQASFSHAMTIVMDACMAAPGIDVPYLSNEDRATAVRQVDEAIANLRKLKRKIVTGRYE